MKTTQYISRCVELDISHRVLHERFKCFSIHGHRVKVELTFSYDWQEDIGYAIDFKEIKRIGCLWLDEVMDHGFIANPQDEIMINACKQTKSKLYIMSLNGEHNYCNPTAENIAREIFLAMEVLFSEYKHLSIFQVRYDETPHCSVAAVKESIKEEERQHFLAQRFVQLQNYLKEKGKLEYDARKV